MMANHRWRAATERTVAVDRTGVASDDPGRFLAKSAFLPHGWCDANRRQPICHHGRVGRVFSIDAGDEPGPKQPAAVTASTRQYLVECKIVSDDPLVILKLYRAQGDRLGR